jgi:putative heme-binding domain-containing protein
VSNEDASVDARVAAAKSIVSVNGAGHVQALELILYSADEPMKLREQSAQSLAEINTGDSKAVLVKALAIAPQNVQTKIALALAGNADGAEILLDSVANGKASARLLQERAVKDRLTAAKPADLNGRLEKLTKNLPPVDAARQKVIDERIAAFNSVEASATAGALIFQKNCMPCHSLDGQGAKIGPQLDGVGNRGAARIVEDILDPNRNVDRAFRSTLFTMKDGEVQSGLFRREEGETIVLAESTGKEISIAKKDVAERRESETSLMPENFSDLIPQKDFDDLLAYLLSKGRTAAKK